MEIGMHKVPDWIYDTPSATTNMNPFGHPLAS
jgi:hypothetical protein